MNATKWSSLTEFAKHLGREGIVTVKEDEKDGLCIAWRDVSVGAVQRREAIREMELAEARSGASEDKMLKRMAKRAQEQAEEKARMLEERKAAQEKSEPSPTEETTDGQVESGAPAVDAAPTAPVKISFGLKSKAAPPTKPVLNGFKRARNDEQAGEKPKKKLRL
jgi:DNA/RNA-binding protein KIN17